MRKDSKHEANDSCLPSAPTLALKKAPVVFIFVSKESRFFPPIIAAVVFLEMSAPVAPAAASATIPASALSSLLATVACLTEA